MTMNAGKTLENIEILRAQPKDLVEVLNLVEEINNESYSQFDDGSWTTNGWRENFIEYLEKKINENTAVVSMVKDLNLKEIVSCGICIILNDVPSPWTIDGKYGFVRSMSTKTSHRSMGLGKLVIEDILKWAKEIGLNSVRLNTSEGAENFYERAGFEIFPYPAMSIWFDNDNE